MVEHGVRRPTFYLFGGGERGRTKYDPPYCLDDAHIRERLRALRDADIEIGLHCGFLAHNDLGLLSEQKDRIEQWLGRPIVGNRAHFFRFAYPSSWYWQQQAGFKYDVSLGYPDEPGIRNGCASPIMPEGFDKNNPFFVLPTAFLDQHFFWPKRMPAEQQKALIDFALVEAEKVGGTLVLDWHTYTLGTKGYEGWWEPLGHILKQTAAKGARLAGVENLFFGASCLKTNSNASKNHEASKMPEEILSTSNFYEQSAIWDQATERYQIEVLNDILAILPEDARSILDVGCGDGFITDALPQDRKVMGLDISAEALSRVKRQTTQGSILDLPFADASFDLVMCNDVLEHLTEQERAQAMKELARVAAKYVLIITPLWEDLNLGTVHCVTCNKFFHVNYHKKSFTPADHRALLSQNDWHCNLQVLSGDIYKLISPEVTLLNNALLKHDLSYLSHALCEHCGAPLRRGEEGEEETKIAEDLAYFMAWRQNKKGEIPDNIRTECISLFSKEKMDILPTEGFYDASLLPCETESKQYRCHAIYFSQEKLFRNINLQSSFSRPQYLNTAQPVGKGSCLDGGGKVLFSFYPQGGIQGQQLEVSGLAQQNGKVIISSYFNKCFTELGSMSVQKGQFSFALTLPDIPLSIYGFLFRLSSSVTLNLDKAALVPAKESGYVVCATGGARFWRMPVSEPLALSLHIYEGELALEPWMSVPSRIDDKLAAHPTLLSSKDDAPMIARLSETSRLFVAAGDAAVAKERDLFQTQIDRQQLQIDRQQSICGDLGCRLELAQADINRILRLLHIRMLQKIKGKFISIFKPINIKTSLENVDGLGFDYCKSVLDQADSPKLNNNWEMQIEGRPSFLMICHDQDIDRRVIQQARSLRSAGWEGMVVALSHNNDDILETMEDVLIQRISLGRIVPECGLYWAWKRREHIIATWFFAAVWQRINRFLYKISLRLKYNGINIQNPLPFDHAFYGAARHYRADVVQAHDLPALKTAVKLAEQWEIPAVYDSHELYVEQIAFSRAQKKIMMKTESENINKCAAVFTVNRSIAKEMAARYDCPEPYELINALDRPEGLEPQARLFHEHFGLPAEKIIFLLQGGLVPNRNLEIPLQAMSQVINKDIVLIYMGNGPLKERLKKLNQQLGLEDRVLFRDAVSQHDVLRWSCTADVGIIPYPAIDLNTKLCTPNKLFEYLQAGLPILANDLPELRRFIYDTGFGKVVAMENVKELARAMDFFAAIDEREQICKNILSRQQEYSWQQASQQYVAVMGGLLKKGVA